MVVTCEYPNGLAFSRDDRALYITNTLRTHIIHAIKIDAEGNMSARRIFADLSEKEPGIPEVMKVNQFGHVFCTGPCGNWV